LQSLRENLRSFCRTFSFSGSIADNIRLGNKAIEDEEIVWAAKGSSRRRIRTETSEAYRAEVRERGAGLSVGQKQLISFARALAFDPKILVLDEATSSIDTETEQLIQQAVDRVMRERTSLIVAHRLSTIQKCDRILVFHHGELREAGTHNELLTERGLYWRLYQLQYVEEKLENPASGSQNQNLSLESGAI
jgi:ATP-binding cassette subfamily B protein